MIIGIDGSRAFVPQKTGVENYSWHLIRELSQLTKENYHPKILNTKYEIRLYLRPGQAPDFPLPQNWEVKILPWPRFFTQIGLALETIFHPPDVLFIPAHTLPLLTKLLRPKVKIVVTIHGWEAGYLPRAYALRSRLWLLESTRWAVSFADHLIAVSAHTKSDIVKVFRCPPEKISVVHEGVDFAHFHTSASRELKKAIHTKYKIQNTKYILFVGTLQPRKNVNRLIRAFAKVLKTQPRLDLLIVGKPGWDYEDTLALPAKLGIAPRVKFLQFVSNQDLPALYQKASVFCLPSLAEGFGLPVLEAMAAGVPVVAANTTALPEVVGDAGILVNPLSINSIAQGIRLALGISTRQGKGVTIPISLSSSLGKKLPRQMRILGQKQAQQFSWKNTADNTIKILLQKSANPI